MRLRWLVSPTKVNAAGRHATGYGLRVGYWPCLRAPYMQLAFGRRRLDVWFGDPSYKETRA